MNLCTWYSGFPQKKVLAFCKKIFGIYMTRRGLILSIPCCIKETTKEFSDQVVKQAIFTNDSHYQKPSCVF